MVSIIPCISLHPYQCPIYICGKGLQQLSGTQYVTKLDKHLLSDLIFVDMSSFVGCKECLFLNYVRQLRSEEDA